MSYIDLNIRMCFLKSLYAFRCCNDAQELNIFSTMLFDKIYRCNGRTTCRKHRIGHYNQSFFDRIRQFAVILMWFMCFLITIQSDMSDLCGRHKCRNSVYHTKSGTKNRHNCHFSSGDHRRLASLNRCLDRHIFRRKVAKCFISHKHRNFLYQRTKFIGSCRLISQS